jgi:hypothetical protein
MESDERARAQRLVSQILTCRLWCRGINTCCGKFIDNGDLSLVCVGCDMPLQARKRAIELQLIADPTAVDPRQYRPV